MKKYVLESKNGGEHGVSVFLANLTPIFRSDSAQEWSDNPANARKFRTAKAAREFAEKWRIDAAPKAYEETPEAPANDEPETADENKAAAMTAQESAARKMIAEQTTEYLLKTRESTTANNDPFIPTVRGWLMDELQSRYPEAYDAWLDSEVCEDAALRGYIEAAERATQDSAEAGEPAPQGDAAPSVYATRNPVAPYDIFRYHPESGTYLFENEGEAALIDALNFHADSGNALSVVNALYEITHDGGGWFSPRNHPVMLDALNDYISFLTDEIEIYDNFPNAAEKEIAVGKLAEAKVIRDAFAADVARAAA